MSKEAKWCCVQANPKGKKFYADWSLGYTRKQSIAFFLDDDNKPFDWNYYKKENWQCKKVWVEITER